jgi:hypothetical protein
MADVHTRGRGALRVNSQAKPFELRSSTHVLLLTAATCNMHSVDGENSWRFLNILQIMWPLMFYSDSRCLFAARNQAWMIKWCLWAKYSIICILADIGSLSSVDHQSCTGIRGYRRISTPHSRRPAAEMCRENRSNWRRRAYSKRELPLKHHIYTAAALQHPKHLRTARRFLATIHRPFTPDGRPKCRQ